ncbi:MAG: cobalt-precorrin-5B (C(1))-methyltransferase CbiD [Sulfurimonas sp.]
MAEKLRSGYTTGTHATATLVACVHECVSQKESELLEIVLPQQKVAAIEVVREGACFYSSIKGDNDDIDVTKGAKISCRLLREPPRDIKEQTPSILEIKNTKLFIYAGEGVGVVTKKGLKIAPNHPAINPTPLAMMRENVAEILDDASRELYALFCVEDGEIIARDTANAKVGVLGGISILGTRGIVKPVSASAYIDSIETEIDVAAAQTQDTIVFTLGNTAVDFAKEHYDEVSIIEIGNFVYDATARLKKHHFKKLLFITSVAKMTKVAQGFKNTHNRYGTIDFEKVKKWLREELSVELEDEEFVTLKGVLQSLPKEYHQDFVELLTQKAAKQLKEWLRELGVEIESVEVVTLPYKINYAII